MKARTIAILAVVAALLAVYPIFHIVKTVSAYNSAQACIDDGRYAEAKEQLEMIRKTKYRDTEALLRLCEAHRQYDAGHAVDAYFTLKLAEFRHQTEPQNKKIRQFQAVLEKAWHDYFAEQYAKENQANEARITGGVPYVGMPESRIGDTSLGRPSDRVRHNRQVKDGQQPETNIYDFYRDGTVIFTARCIQGIVTEVWDWRGEKQSTAAPRSGGTPIAGGPDVSGFSHPEDFYDWYRDDFFDYEDAEEFYYAHGGE